MDSEVRLQSHEEGRHTMTRAVAVKAMLVALLLAAAPGSAAADPPTTPNGWEGACNMNQSWPGLGGNSGLGVQPGGGMERAMTVDNPHGNEGMLGATERTSDVFCG
jgi:hypothetical protein